MPTPTNAPSSGSGAKQIQNSTAFSELTERQEMPQATAEIKGLGKTQRLTIEKIGVIARARLIIKCSFKPVGEEEPTIGIGMPQRLIKSIAIQANGVTGIIQCGGAALEQRRRRVYRNPVSAVNKGPVGGEKMVKKTEVTVETVIEVPIAHDMNSLIGALLAQNEETQLGFEITWASEEELVHGGKIELFKGEVEWATTTFSIGTTKINEGKEEVTVLPDLSAFHGILEEETGLLGTGERKAPLIRTDGQLLCYTATILNTKTTEISPAKWTNFEIEYGGNKKPLVWTPASQLLEENADDYDGPLNINGQHFLAYDIEKDNPSRDMIIPADLVELRGVITIPSGETVENEHAQIVTTQETLYPAV